MITIEIGTKSTDFSDAAKELFDLLDGAAELVAEMKDTTPAEFADLVSDLSFSIVSDRGVAYILQEQPLFLPCLTPSHPEMRR